MKKRKMKKTRKINFKELINAGIVLTIAIFAIYAIIHRINEINTMNYNAFTFLFPTMR